MSREPISKRLRFEVFKRDGFVCQYCGAHPPDVKLEADHIQPVSAGGPTIEENLITACEACNRGKSNIPLSTIPKSLPDKAVEVKELEDQLAGYREVMQARADRIDDDMWRVAEELQPGCMQDGMDRRWLQSIKRFNTLLPIHEVMDAAEITRAFGPYSKWGRFRYFCGVCWNKIRRDEQ